MEGVFIMRLFWLRKRSNYNPSELSVTIQDVEIVYVNNDHQMAVRYSRRAWEILWLQRWLQQMQIKLIKFYIRRLRYEINTAG